MHEHFSHLLITALPFVAIALLVIWRYRPIGILKVSLILVLFLVVSVQAVPVHYLHAAHAQDLQTYQCCIPAPTVATSSFELIIPQLSPVSAYVLAEVKADFLPNLIQNNRSPPLG